MVCLQSCVGLFSLAVKQDDVWTDKCSLLSGEEIGPTDFERRGGRAQSKKWKESVKLFVDGPPGLSIGKWLTQQAPAQQAPAQQAPAQVHSLMLSCRSSRGSKGSSRDAHWQVALPCCRHGP